MSVARTAKAREARRRYAERRMAAYREQRESGLRIADAAEAVGVAYSTATQYDARLRAAGWAAPVPAGRRSDAAGRAEDYAWLRNQGEPAEAAARRVGVSLRTAERYEARLREGRAA